jgi:ribose 5-phosphate isomerase B
MMETKIAVASDHGGFYLKDILVEFLKKLGYQVHDLGTDSDEPVDYPVYGRAFLRRS